MMRDQKGNMAKPIVKVYWRVGNTNAIIESAKNRLREAHKYEEALKLEKETSNFRKTGDYEKVIKIISKYCEVR